MFHGTQPATNNLKGISGHPTSVPPLTPPSTSIILSAAGVVETERKRECMFLFWGRKAFSWLRMLPLKLEKLVSCGGNDHRMDEAWSRHRVPSISWVQVTQLQSVQHFFCGTKSVSLLQEVSGKSRFEFYGLSAHVPAETKPFENALVLCLCRCLFPLMDSGCFEDWLTDGLNLNLTFSPRECIYEYYTMDKRQVDASN